MFAQIKSRPLAINTAGSSATSQEAALPQFKKLSGKSVRKVTMPHSNSKMQAAYNVFLLSAFTHLNPLLITQVLVHPEPDSSEVKMILQIHCFFMNVSQK